VIAGVIMNGSVFCSSVGSGRKVNLVDFYTEEI